MLFLDFLNWNTFLFLKVLLLKHIPANYFPSFPKKLFSSCPKEFLQYCTLLPRPTFLFRSCFSKSLSLFPKTTPCFTQLVLLAGFFLHASYFLFLSDLIAFVFSDARGTLTCVGSGRDRDRWKSELRV